MTGWQWHQPNHMLAICTLLQKITAPTPHQSHFYGPDVLPDTHPTVSKHWRPSCCSSDSILPLCISWMYTDMEILNVGAVIPSKVPHPMGYLANHSLLGSLTPCVCHPRHHFSAVDCCVCMIVLTLQAGFILPVFLSVECYLKYTFCHVMLLLYLISTATLPIGCLFIKQHSSKQHSSWLSILCIVGNLLLRFAAGWKTYSSTPICRCGHDEQPYIWHSYCCHTR